MSLAAWKIGTSRYAYLLTGIYTVVLVVGLPLTISLNDVVGWLTFSCVMVSGVCNLYLAWKLRGHARSGAVQRQEPLGR